MDRLNCGLLVLITLTVGLVLLAGCAKRVELRLDAKQTYVGPEVADSINVRLTDSWGFDYKVNMSCTFTNVGAPGGVIVLGTVAQGNESWERRETIRQAVVGQPMTSEFVFAEPTFDWGSLLVPVASLVVPGPWSGMAMAFLGGEEESGIRGACQVIPRAEDMKMRLDCLVSNVGEGSGTVTVKGIRNGIHRTSDIAIGPKEQKTVPFLFQMGSSGDRFECQIE